MNKVSNKGQQAGRKRKVAAMLIKYQSASIPKSKQPALLVAIR